MFNDQSLYGSLVPHLPFALHRSDTHVIKPPWVPDRGCVQPEAFQFLSGAL